MSVSSVKNQSKADQIRKLTQDLKKQAVGDAKKGIGVDAAQIPELRKQGRSNDDISGLSLGKIAKSDPKLAATLDQLHKAISEAVGTTGMKAEDLSDSAASGLNDAIDHMASQLGLDTGTLRNLMFGTSGAAHAGVSGGNDASSSGGGGGGSKAGSSGSNDIGLASAKKVGTGSVTQGGGDIVANKKAALAGIPGATPAEKAFIIAVGMQETNSFSANERDKSKDGNTDGSKNFSAFNMNEAMLKDMGLSPQKMAALNDPKNQGEAAKVLLQATKKYGQDGVLAWHRGGGSCYDAYVASGYKNMTKGSVGDPGWYQSYYNSVYSAQNAIAADSKKLTDSSRVGTGAAHG